MKTPKCVLAERRRLRKKGLLPGVATRILHHMRDGRAHHIRLVLYSQFNPIGPSTVYAELWETHDRARRAKILPLCDLVHVMQNLSYTEVREVAKRRKVGKER